MQYIEITQYITIALSIEYLKLAILVVTLTGTFLPKGMLNFNAFHTMSHPKP